MDLEADRAELRRLWRKEYAEDDPEFSPAAGIDPEADIEERWNSAGRLRELLSALFEDDDPLIRLRAAQVALSHARSPAPPEEAIRALEEIAALPHEVGRTDSLNEFWSYAHTAREILETQARRAEVPASDARAMADVLESVAAEAGSFFDLGWKRPVETPPETAELASALRELARTPDDDATARVAIPWFLAINALRILGALADVSFVMDSGLGYNAGKNAAAERLGHVLYGALEPRREEFRDDYDEKDFILLSSGWEIVG